MKFVSTLLMFFGYMLIYAAVAASGKFATEPWVGCFADAYTEAVGPAATPLVNGKLPPGFFPKGAEPAPTPAQMAQNAAKRRFDPSQNRVLPPR